MPEARKKMSRTRKIIWGIGVLCLFVVAATLVELLYEPSESTPTTTTTIRSGVALDGDGGDLYIAARNLYDPPESRGQKRVTPARYLIVFEDESKDVGVSAGYKFGGASVALYHLEILQSIYVATVTDLESGAVLGSKTFTGVMPTFADLPDSISTDYAGTYHSEIDPQPFVDWLSTLIQE